MRSNTAKRILDQTPEWQKEVARYYAALKVGIPQEYFINQYQNFPNNALVSIPRVELSKPYPNRSFIPKIVPIYSEYVKDFSHMNKSDSLLNLVNSMNDDRSYSLHISDYFGPITMNGKFWKLYLQNFPEK